MIDLGSSSCRSCQGASRRTFLRAGCAAPFALGAAGLGTPDAAETPKARSVLLIWLGGGPSRLDLFDPKPNAPAQSRGPFATIATRTPGLRLTELLPRLAERTHLFSLIWSHVNFHGGHREAGSIALTGAAAATEAYPPNFGSIVARQRGEDRLPGFISLAHGPVGDGVGPIQGYGGGTWGQGHDPFLIGCTEAGRLELPSLRLADGLPPARNATSHPARDDHAAWHPDGRRLLFVSDRDGGSDLYLMTAPRGPAQGSRRQGPAGPGRMP